MAHHDHALGSITNLTRNPRQTLYVPRHLHAQFRKIAKQRNHQMSSLLWSALYDAVSAARRGEELPPVRYDGPVRNSPQLRWRQDKLEYVSWSCLLKERGSSVYTVLVTFIEKYVEADGAL